MFELPYITSKELKTDGKIKEEPSHFLVDEIPLYTPSGDGQHVYLLIQKTNLNSSEVEEQLAKLFNITSKDIGSAGQKDKCAITTQWFSLSLGATANLEQVCEEVSKNIEGIKVLKSSKHINKLKTGHLIGNKFTITISETNEDAYLTAQKIANELKVIGIPNFYGHQRFGSKGDNAISGREVLKGQKKVKKNWLKKMFLSAYQSELFNKWLSQRISDNLFSSLIEGDLLQKSEGGRSFPFDKEKSHDKEFINHEVTYTGPIFGSKVNGPTHLAKEREDKIFTVEDISIDEYKKNKLQGTRRAAIVFPEDLTINQSSTNNLIISFSLPSGSYATILIREFTKNF